MEGIMRELVNPQTLTILEHLEATDIRCRFEGYPRKARQLHDSTLLTPELALIRARLLYFDALLAEQNVRGEPLYAEGDPAALNWLNYLEEHKIVPIYDDAVALMRHRRLVQPQEVLHILRFIGVARSNYGVDDPENHRFGYHFHFGKVKRNTLTRFNVVLTFDDRQPKPQNSHDPLFSEEHGSGRYTHIDVATIGQNVRYPVYKICEQEMSVIGRQHFKNPARKASCFY